MSRFKTVVTLALVAFWAAAIHHCEIEQLPGFAFLACHAECEPPLPLPDDPCAADGCAWVENGFYKSEETEIETTGPSFTGEFTTAQAPLSWPPLVIVPPQVHDRASPTLDGAPDWRFALRVAPPARAPSTTA
ncbi:MAG TPA: hypothetical protein VNO52_02565 [Methylomirabilota bacterium]|nr:hypothetical protein [Methylomirabilota bacterium]